MGWINKKNHNQLRCPKKYQSLVLAKKKEWNLPSNWSKYFTWLPKEFVLQVKKFFFGRLKMVQYNFLSLLSYLIYHKRIPYSRRLTCYEISEDFKNPPQFIYLNFLQRWLNMGKHQKALILYAYCFSNKKYLSKTFT